MTKALAATKSATYLMLMPVPPAMLTVPSLFLATLLATVLISLVALGLSLLRARAPVGSSSGGPYLPAAGAANALLVLLSLWLAGMVGITVLWAGATMVSEKSTADAASTLASVDPAIQRLIFQASGGAINGTESGFIVSVGQGKVRARRRRVFGSARQKAPSPAAASARASSGRAPRVASPEHPARPHQHPSEIPPPKKNTPATPEHARRGHRQEQLLALLLCLLPRHDVGLDGLLL
jgi:hypothetical protein